MAFSCAAGESVQNRVLSMQMKDMQTHGSPITRRAFFRDGTVLTLGVAALLIHKAAAQALDAAGTDVLPLESLTRILRKPIGFLPPHPYQSNGTQLSTQRRGLSAHEAEVTVSHSFTNALGESEQRNSSYIHLKP
jgi:hypothetical protein